MNKKNISTIKNFLEVLNGKKLQSFIRSGSMGDLGFGDYIEKNIRGFNDEKKLISKIVYVPQYVLHIDCHFRLSCGDEIILSRGDIFQPSNVLYSDSNFDYEAFDWDISDNNRFDEISKKMFHNQNSTFIVSKIIISKFGDIKIHFENGFLLDICPDISGNEECWRFFEQLSDEHLIVSGNGIVEEDN
ncbi:hypothetical protein [Chakrabartyella piscis]|uniref:hypothetical protein n=1 Tax=Chakrabartyella piscis TaxID=2918914 RepID=UPI0029583482|nr:hypothetical protein [Chakrabartyella piscis]